jgi:hypothetical protein
MLPAIDSGVLLDVGKLVVNEKETMRRRNVKAGARIRVDAAWRRRAKAMVAYPCGMPRLPRAWGYYARMLYCIQKNLMLQVLQE